MGLPGATGGYGRTCRLEFLAFFGKLRRLFGAHNLRSNRRLIQPLSRHTWFVYSIILKGAFTNSRFYKCPVIVSYLFHPNSHTYHGARKDPPYPTAEEYYVRVVYASDSWLFNPKVATRDHKIGGSEGGGRNLASLFPGTSASTDRPTAWRVRNPLAFPIARTVVRSRAGTLKLDLYLRAAPNLESKLSAQPILIGVNGFE